LPNYKHMILKDKIAVIYGATGSVGTAVALKFASEGAIVLLVARNSEKLKALSDKIGLAGRQSCYHTVNALDQNEVTAHLEWVREKFSRVDISINLISIDDVQGKPLTDIEFADFMLPIHTAMQTQFITAVAAAQMMNTQKSGVILMLTAQCSKIPYVNTGGFGIACAAMEALGRQLAKECGHNNVRVVCLRSSGSPDAAGVDEVFSIHAENEGISRKEFEDEFAQRTMLKRLPLLNEVANTAAMMASDFASAITATIVNVTCGEIAD
jgi:NAD(P)-dependent dehydrogenase (short-subunit alcohol dehydrogenase family)